MTSPIDFFVPGEAVPQPRPRGQWRPGKHGRGGFVHIYNPSDADDWKEAVARYARTTFRIEPLAIPLRLCLSFRMVRPMSHYLKSGLRPDAPPKQDTAADVVRRIGKRHGLVLSSYMDTRGRRGFRGWGGHAEFFASSTCMEHRGGWAKFYESSTCVAHSGGEAEFMECSLCRVHAGGHAKFEGRSTCEKHIGGHGTFRDCSVCTEYGGGYSNFYGSSTCKTHGGGEACFSDSSTCERHSGGAGDFCGSSVCRNKSGGKAKFWDACVCEVHSGGEAMLHYYSVCHSHTGGTVILMESVNGTWTEVSRVVKPDKKGHQ